MKQELDDYLVKTYPKMFVERNLSMMQTCMCWGFTCDDGWLNIIDRLCSKIQSHIDWKAEQREFIIRYNQILEDAKQGNFKLFDEEYDDNIYKDSAWLEKRRAEVIEEEPRMIAEIVPQVVVNQVKEKYGTLRFYYTGGDRFVDGLVGMAEEMSLVTCESCGAPGKLRGRGWYYTACDKHTKKEDLAVAQAGEK